MEKNIKIRVARAQDAEALARIYAYYVEKTAITFEYEAPDAAEMETRRKKIFEHYPYLVAEQAGHVLGYAYAHAFYGRAAYAWSVEVSIYVASDARGQGLGRKLYAALEDALRGMDRREAALATRLCNGVLQNRMLLDHWLSGFVRGKLQPVVRDILRLAAYQLCFLDRIPPSAAVNEAVEQTRRLANQQAVRLVNGVLRNLLRAMPLALPDDLSLRYSHPEPIVRLFLAQFGREETERILQTDNEAPQTVLQVNPLRGNAAALLEELPGAQPHPWLPGCLTVSGPVEQTAAFREGRVYVQDAAAHLAVAVSGIEPGMRVLDCCAAPGGKSFAAALQMQDRGTLYSCDIHPHRLDLIERGAERLGISILETHLQDASQPVPAWRSAMDVVLADVPCSGLGVIRKKPDIRYHEPSAELPALQRAILAQQAEYVRPGGVLLYSTCTILRRENEAVAEDFLRTHPDFVPENAPWPEGSGIAPGAMVTLLPGQHETDGFFICKFRRKP